MDPFPCGQWSCAQQAASALAQSIGLDVVDAGGLKNARCLEPLADLNIYPGHGAGLGPAIAPLADEAVLIVGSGSLTHNLHEFRSGYGPDQAYVVKFAAWVREAVEQGARARLLRTLDDAPDALRAHPTAEHFWPLLVAVGAADTILPASVIEGGIAHGMLAMDSYVFGASGVAG